MFDRVPKTYDDPKEWFNYFRMTKYLPAMPRKFEQQMGRVPTAEAARTVMTAFASAALDIMLMYPSSSKTFARDMELSCGLRPDHLLQLSVDELAKPLKVSAPELSSKLSEAGFSVDAKGAITSFTRPAPDAKPQRAPKI